MRNREREGARDFTGAVEPRREGWRVGAAVAFVFALVGPGCAGTQVPQTPLTPPAEALFNGRVRDDVTCYKCHNGDGTGTLRGPNLGKRVPKLTDDDIVKAIAEGPGLMPSFKGKVSEAESRQIAAWLHAKFPKAP